MADQAPKKAKLGLGHWVALGGAAVGLILLLVQMILVFTIKPGAGTIIHAIVHTLLLGAFVAAAVIALWMARKNARLYTLVYVLAAATFLLAPVTILHAGAGAVTFYFSIGVLAFIVGALIASGALTLPTSADVRSVAEELHHKAEPEAEEKPEAEEGPKKKKKKKKDPDLGDVPLA